MNQAVFTVIPEVNTPEMGLELGTPDRFPSPNGGSNGSKKEKTVSPFKLHKNYYEGTSTILH